jgi:hypothetical protein
MWATQEDRPSLLLAPSQMDFLNPSTQKDHAPTIPSVTQSEGLGSLPTQAAQPFRDGAAAGPRKCTTTLRTPTLPSVDSDADRHEVAIFIVVAALHRD